MKDRKIAIVGLGYVGLPLFCLFCDKYEAWGIDIDSARVVQLRVGKDPRACESRRRLSRALQHGHITASWEEVRTCDFYIVTVPTPIDKNKKPDVMALKSACASIGQVLKTGDIVVFESTVFPGATEEVCVPVLEQYSGLSLNRDFSVGYSPERVNVADTVHRISTVKKIVSASNPSALAQIVAVYQPLLHAPIVQASQIKVAEAAKIYENTQRDVLIALANEYADYCRKENVDIKEVTRCASSKWNFATVYPGMVGGHCIGTDPYYLLERSNTHHVGLPLIRQARIINEHKSEQIAHRICQLCKSVVSKQSEIRILLLGFAYKPDTPDSRNTKIADIMTLLRARFPHTECYDPLVDRQAVAREYGLNVCNRFSELAERQFDVVINVVPHRVFEDMDFSHYTHPRTLVTNIEALL